MQRTIRSFIYGCTMFGVLGYLPSLGAAEPSTNKASTPVKIHKQGSLIDNLNLRYNDKVANCGGNTSALNCSGIILRRAKLEDGVEFWKLKEAATVLDSVTFSWLRADGASDSNDLSSGFIYMDQSTARASKYELPSPRCIYPFMAGTQNAKRMLKGCGPSDTPISEQPGKSYCITKGVDDLDSWLKDFEESKANVVKQCSLSVDGLPHQLIISLQVRKKYSELAKRYGNELLIPLWKEDKVNQLPIEAFFFKTADSGAFDFTLKLRESFYNKTGRMVPLVGLQFSTKDTHVFKPLTRDQQGRATANALNLRYAKTDPNCNDKAAVYCNGVLVRAVEFETTARAWNPSNKSQDSGAVSFSYLRTDLGIRRFVYSRGQGLIFSELDAGKQPRMYPVTPRCIYVTNASTDSRTLKGCGPHSDYPRTSVQCTLQSIVDWKSFKAHYNALDKDPNKHQCSLSINQREFDIATTWRKYILTPQRLQRHNELVMATWPQDIPDRLPLDGFFYQYKDPATGNTALDQAKSMQKDLYNRANKLWKPVIRLNLAATSRDGFATYRAEDQSQLP